MKAANYIYVYELIYEYTHTYINTYISNTCVTIVLREK